MTLAARLGDLPVDVITIDRSFVHDLGRRALRPPARNSGRCSSQAPTVCTTNPTGP